MVCSKCHKETLECYFDKCEECYALEVLSKFPPDLFEKIYPDCDCGSKEPCGRCYFINKYTILKKS